MGEPTPPPRRVRARPGQLLARWGRDDDGFIGVVYAAGGAGAGGPDAGMLLNFMEGVIGLHGRTLRDELVARGFDITTLRFSVEQKVDVT